MERRLGSLRRHFQVQISCLLNGFCKPFNSSTPISSSVNKCKLQEPACLARLGRVTETREVKTTHKSWNMMLCSKYQFTFLLLPSSNGADYHFPFLPGQGFQKKAKGRFPQKPVFEEGVQGIRWKLREPSSFKMVGWKYHCVKPMHNYEATLIITCNKRHDMLHFLFYNHQDIF